MTMPGALRGISLWGVLLSVGVGVVAGTGAYAFHYGEGLSYLSNDPKACMNCHVMRDHYDAWSKAGHHHVATCNDCHTPHDLVGKYLTKAENGFWHSKGFTLQDFHEPIRIRPGNSRVLQGACTHCHAELVDPILGHGTHVGHGTEDAVYCVRCHPAAGHGPPR